MSRYKYAALSVGLTAAVSLVLILYVKPRMGPWLELQAAYRNLSSKDDDDRDNAIRLLRRRGETAESQLISLLHHSDEGIRRFASRELAHRTPLNDGILEAFLVSLESKHHVAEIGLSAPKLFFRHAEDAIGPLKDADRRMIAVLIAELNSANLDRSGTAAWALTAFVNRDPSLREPLNAFLKRGSYFYKYIVLREMADNDSSMRDAYVEVLVHGLGSPAFADQSNALHGLAKLKSYPADLISRLEERREESTDPEEVLRIDQALEGLQEHSSE